MFLARPTQNFFVPIEQFFGINASIVSGIAVMIVPAALWTWLTALGISVAMPLAALPAPVGIDGTMPLLWDSCFTGKFNPVKANCETY
jgi:hypothetical protein